MTRRRTRILIFAVITLVLAIIGLRMYYVTFLRGPKIMRKWVQPDDVHYDGNDPYALTLVHNGYEFEGVFVRPRYRLILAPTGHLLDSGLSYPIFPEWLGGSVPAAVDDMHVAWEKDGPHFILEEMWGLRFPVDGREVTWIKKENLPEVRKTNPQSTTTTTDKQP